MIGKSQVTKTQLQEALDKFIKMTNQRGHVLANERCASSQVAARNAAWLAKVQLTEMIEEASYF